MKIKDCIAFAKCVRNPDSPLTVDAQTVHGESSTCAYHQNEELSSKDVCSPKSKMTLSQIDLSNFPDGSRVLQVGPPLIMDIPDSYIEAVRNSPLGSDKQPPCNCLEDSRETYYKIQSSFLIGKSKLDDI